MVENIARISNDRFSYQAICSRKQGNKQFSRKQNELQNHVIMLIQSKNNICNSAKILRSIDDIIRKCIKYSFDLIHHAIKQQGNKNGKRIEVEVVENKRMAQNCWNVRMTYLLITKIQNKNKWRFLLEGFRGIQYHSKTKNKIERLYHFSQKIVYRLAFKAIKHCSINYNHINCDLHLLDISQISTKKQKQIISTDELLHINLPIVKTEQQRKEQLTELKKKIHQKQQQINQYKQTQQKQISQLQTPPTDPNSSPPHPSSSPQQNIQQILISKYIRKNFILEQKLQTVNEYLRTIYPDKRTEFGRKLAGLIRKKYCNYQLDNL